jgi:hypothetical protein
MPETIIWICGDCQSPYLTNKNRVSDMCLVCRSIELVPVMSKKIVKVHTELKEKRELAVVTLSVFD